VPHELGIPAEEKRGQIVRDRLSGEVVRAIRTKMNLGQPEFALLFGVTIRTVQLWEAGVVEPSVLTSMVIRAEADKHRKITRTSRTSTVARRELSAPRLAARTERKRSRRLA